VVREKDVARPAACDTGPVNRAQVVQWWNAGLAALRRNSSPSPPPSRWAWAADLILAVALTVGTLDVARSRDYDAYHPYPDLPGPLRPQVPPHPLLPTDRLLPTHGAPFPPAPPAPGGPIVMRDFGPVHSWQLILAVLVALPLIARRRYPLAVFWAVVGLAELYHLSPGFDPTFTFAACVIAAYSAIIYSPYRKLAILSALAGAGLIVARHSATVPSLGPGLITFLLLVLIGAAASAISIWKQRVQAMEAQRQVATRLAVEHERSRIARELHDVVTHNVSVMVVQAGAARKVMDAAPEQARTALLAVEAGGRAAMAELRHVMGLLTMDSDGPDPAGSADLTPQPGLDHVPALAARIRETGVPVELTVTGSATPLPAGIDLTAYRVVQEALTNTVKHAAGAEVKITIEYTPTAVRVEVADTGGTTAAPAGPGDGRGLIGLRERLALYGGTLQAGRRPVGGYRVSAVIPMEAP
jgi:signal transduction histidine kinase